jgi:hypothetical protein
LDTFDASEKAVRVYDSIAKCLEGAKTKTNFPDPSLEIDNLCNQRCTTITTIELSIASFTTLHAIAKQVKPSTHHRMISTTVPNPINILDYAILIDTYWRRVACSRILCNLWKVVLLIM